MVRLAHAVALLLAVGAAPAAYAVDAPVAPPVRVPLPAPTTANAAAPAAASSSSEELVGTFRLKAGDCDGNTSGAWFRMIQPGGDTSGPYVTNTDSPCTDQSYTPLEPGTDGGLVTGAFQPHPDPAFGTSGGGTASRITKPQRFFGVNFAAATNPKDPQTGAAVSAPAIHVGADGSLTGDVRAFAAAWNNQHFNQGAPKPDGSTPGATAGPKGTYDRGSGAFVLEWTSQIVGGPFNNFTGQWHLEGTFAPSQRAATTTPTTAAGAPSDADASSAPPSSRPVLASTGSALPRSTPLVAVALGLAALSILRLRRRIDAS
jgi:hypothetical protein